MGLSIPVSKVQQPCEGCYYIVLHVHNLLSSHREQQPRVTTQNIGDPLMIRGLKGCHGSVSDNRGKW